MRTTKVLKAAALVLAAVLAGCSAAGSAASASSAPASSAAEPAGIYPQRKSTPPIGAAGFHRMGGDELRSYNHIYCLS